MSSNKAVMDKLFKLLSDTPDEAKERMFENKSASDIEARYRRLQEQLRNTNDGFLSTNKNR